MRPVFHYREDHISARVQLCWLAQLLIRVAENATTDTWRNTRHELDRVHQVTLATTNGLKTILTALELEEPPRFLGFTPTTED